MNYIEAPEMYKGNEKTLFIGGGISNCPDWQSDFIEYFKDSSLTLLNPRRQNFNIQDSSVEEEQITWEHQHLEASDIISFWFPKETMCPIVLFELGKYARSHKQIHIGIDPEYQRKSDVEIQMQLMRPDIKIVYSIEQLANQILKTL